MTSKNRTYVLNFLYDLLFRLKTLILMMSRTLGMKKYLFLKKKMTKKTAKTMITMERKMKKRQLKRASKKSKAKLVEATFVLLRVKHEI